MLGRSDSSRNDQSVKDNSSQISVARKDEEWFYSFLESLESKDPTKVLPMINRPSLKSEGHHTKPF